MKGQMTHPESGVLAEFLVGSAERGKVTDQDRLGVHRGAVLESHAALFPDGEQGPDQVLPVSHPAGDTVEGDVDDLARHKFLAFGRRRLRC